MPRLEFTGRLSHLRAGIFDVLCLIENDEVKWLLSELFGIALENGKGCQHHIRMRDARKILRSIRARQNENAQRWRKFERFSAPIRHHRCRRYHKAR